ncbi:unnamed protein product [Rhizopus stolonifer]
MKILWLILLLCYSILAVEVPTVNVESISQLGFIGDYVGISPFQDSRQTESIPSNNTALFIHSNNLFTLFSTVDGTIDTHCQLNSTSYILGGTFNTINDTQYNHIAQLNLDTMQLAPLQQGLDGPVRSLYCTNDSVYVGGEFNKPTGYNSTELSYAALYSQGQWTALPWKGFNGPVYTIEPTTQSILFGGKFDTIGDGTFSNQSYQQSFDLSSLATITAGNGGYGSDPTSVVCSQSPWYLQSGNTGYWQAQFPFTIQPSLFRLTNTHNDSGTLQFNIIALGSNDYFQLSYLDPVTQQIQNCSQSCFLSNTTTFQDFTVTSPLTANGVRINIDTWYGTRGGLGGVQIFRSDTSLQPHASSSTNSSSCYSDTQSSSTTTTGNWTETFAYGTYQDFLTSTFSASELSTVDLSVTYQPYIPSQGNYSVYVTTPGCVGTSNCDQRTKVQLLIELTPGNQTTLSLSQQNYEDQRTLIYEGTVSASGTFQPKVVLKIDTANVTLPSSSTVSVIADSMEFIRTSNYTSLSSILEYYPSNQSWSALADQLALGSTVRTLSVYQDTVYIGGQFSQNGTTNIISYKQQTLTPLSTGLNGQVTTSLIAGSKLVVGGNFTQTNNNGLNYIALYDLQTNSWSSISQGLNNQVDHISLLDNTTLDISGPFTQLLGASTVYNNARFSLTNNSWIQPSSFVLGSSQNLALNSTASLYFGDIRNAQSYQTNDVALADSWWVNQNATVESGLVYQDALILSGQFMLESEYQVAMYQKNSWQGLVQGLSGNISTMLIVGHQLFIGGNFTGKDINGLIVYDLENKTMSNVNGVYNANQGVGQVNAMRSNGESVFIAGNFDYAGTLNCGSLCALSTQTLQWKLVGGNSLTGTVNDLSVQDNGTIVAVGDLKVDGQQTPIAELNNQIWTAFSASVTAPTSLLAQGSGNYVMSGRNQNNTFIGLWDGQQFNALNQTNLNSASDIQQLLFVPISSSPSERRYPANSNAMLMAIGHLLTDNGQSSSAALYDGAQWYPYILTAKADGSPGQIRQFLKTSDCCSSIPTQRRYLSVPAVVLISIAISLAILFCLVALGFLVICLKRRKRTYIPPPEWRPRPPTLPPLDLRPFSPPMVPFSSLLAAALRPTADEVPASEERPKMYYAKFPFEAKEFGELPFDANTPIVVTDMTDDVWWMGYKDNGSGQAISGLFPSNYVTTRKPS